MKVLLLNPPYLKKFSRPQRSPAVTKSGTLYYPMWLAYATGVLEKEGFDVMLVDAPAEDYDFNEVLKMTSRFRPDLIVVDTSTPSIYNDVEVTGQLKDISRRAFVILVGTHVSALPEETLRMDERIDAVARHEYDYTLRDLAYALKENRDLENVQGISFRKGDEIVSNPRRPYIKNLDELPFVSKVYKKFLKIGNYFNPNALYPMVTIITSRGCPFGCTFCVYPQTLTGRTYRLRSIENVVDEMEYIIEAFPQIKSIFFEDDTLTVNKKRCLELSDVIIKRGIKISWTANARVGLDYETMKRMEEAGCRCLCVGFESGNQKILDSMKKNLRLEQMFEFMKNAKRAGILIHGCFIAGLPGETRQSLEQTLDLAKRLNPDTAQFYPVMVYPGTEAYNWYKERGLICTENFSHWLTPQGLHNAVVNTEELSAYDLVDFCDKARREFYLRPTYLVSKFWQVIRNPQGEGVRIGKAFKTFYKHLVKGSLQVRF